MEGTTQFQKYEFFITEDGSPSLNYKKPDGFTESMHSRHGALSETFYIYQDAAQFVLGRQWPPEFLSIGLGLGYNELMLATLSVKYKSPIPFKVESYESDYWLVQTFIEWLQDQVPNDITTVWYQNYNLIMQLIAKKLEVNPERIKAVLLDWKANGHWRIKGALSKSSRFTNQFSGIFYDAFSKNTNPELWTEKFLDQFIKDVSAPQCVFVTYAATGNLNRCLRTQGYLLDDKEGFGGKRQSTFAIRLTFNN